MRGRSAVVVLGLVVSCRAPSPAGAPLPTAAPPITARGSSVETPATATPAPGAPGAPASSPPPAPDTDLGGAHPVLLAAADPGRRWLAVCQAREDTDGDGTIAAGVSDQGELTGDRLTGYLVTATGVDEPIDAFAGHSPDGRFIAFVEDATLWLLDVETGRRVDLSARGADIRDDRSTFAGHRATAFDPTGARMLYHRREGEHATIVVRQLASGDEHAIAVTEGLLWRADFDATGRRVVARIITDDTNKNGRLDWPKPERGGQAMRCGAAVPRAAVWENGGDGPRLGVAEIGAAGVAPSSVLVAALGSARVERHPDGTTLWRLKDGSTRLLAADACHASVVHADPGRDLAVVTCRDKKTGRHALSLRGVGFEKDLGLAMVTPGGDAPIEATPRLYGIHAGRDAAIVDMKRRTASLLAPGDRIAATSDAHALVVRGDRLLLRDASGTETELGIDMAPFGHLLRTGDMVAADPWVVDLGRGSLVGRLDAAPLALSADGYGLIPAEDAGAPAVPRGPLRWHAPTPTPTPPPAAATE